MQEKSSYLSLLLAMAIWKDRKFYVEIITLSDLKLLCVFELLNFVLKQSSWSKRYIQDEIETTEPMQYWPVASWGNACTYCIHWPVMSHSCCMHLLHGILSFKFVKDIPLLQLLWYFKCQKIVKKNLRISNLCLYWYLFWKVVELWVFFSIWAEKIIIKTETCASI